MNTLFEHLTVSPAHEATLAHQIKQQLAYLIAGGRLQPGERLPDVRTLADRLGVNLHTVRRAYRMLAEDGLVEVRRGRGTHVLAFDPFRIARSAAAVRSHTVGVILPSFFNPFYHPLLHGIQDAADRDRTLLFICITRDDPAEAWRYYARLAARRVDGIIAISTDFDRPPGGEADAVDWPGLPLVTVDRPGAAGLSVNLDLEGAGYQATRHLLEHGRRRIGLITVDPAGSNIRPLVAGCRRALAEADAVLEPELVAEIGAFDLAAGAEGAQMLLTRPHPPDAIFAIADLLAIGALQAVRAAGLRVPEDLALVGFNDIPLAGQIDPPLTSVSAPAFALGQTAMRMLQERIAGKQPARTEVVLPTTLVLRSSCGEHLE